MGNLIVINHVYAEIKIYLTEFRATLTLGVSAPLIDKI